MQSQGFTTPKYPGHQAGREGRQHVKVHLEIILQHTLVLNQEKPAKVEQEKGPHSGWEESGRSDGLSLENLVTVVLEECGLLGVELTDAQRQLNAPLM